MASREVDFWNSTNPRTESVRKTEGAVKCWYIFRSKRPTAPSSCYYGHTRGTPTCPGILTTITHTCGEMNDMNLGGLGLVCITETSCKCPTPKFMLKTTYVGLFRQTICWWQDFPDKASLQSACHNSCQTRASHHVHPCTVVMWYQVAFFLAHTALRWRWVQQWQA